MAAIGVYLFRPPHNGAPTKQDIEVLETILMEEGYEIDTLRPFGDVDVFLKLASGPNGDRVRALSRDTRERLASIDYTNTTRHYELS